MGWAYGCVKNLSLFASLVSNFCDNVTIKSVSILDADDFEPSTIAAPAVKSDKWEGEDEEENIKVLSG